MMRKIELTTLLGKSYMNLKYNWIVEQNYAQWQSINYLETSVIVMENPEGL